MGDCGITGRKLVVDFYGSGCEIGGGSPWTKDGTKADLTLNLKARQIAFNALCSFNIDYAKVQLACCIGKPDVSFTIFGADRKVISKGSQIMRPSELITHFNLDKPVFADLCRFGLF
jgi:S-adenosylmethionine synthetase